MGVVALGLAALVQRLESLLLAARRVLGRLDGLAQGLDDALNPLLALGILAGELVVVAVRLQALEDGGALRHLRHAFGHVIIDVGAPSQSSAASSCFFIMFVMSRDLGISRDLAETVATRAARRTIFIILVGSG